MLTEYGIRGALAWVRIQGARMSLDVCADEPGCALCDGTGEETCECEDPDGCDECGGFSAYECSRCEGFGSEARRDIAHEAERLWLRDIMRGVGHGNADQYIAFAWAAWLEAHPTGRPSPDQIPFPFMEAA